MNTKKIDELELNQKARLTSEVLVAHGVSSYFYDFIVRELSEGKKCTKYVDNDKYKGEFTEIIDVYNLANCTIVKTTTIDNNCSGGRDDRGSCFSDVYFNDQADMHKYIEGFRVISETEYTGVQNPKKHKIEKIITTKSEGCFSQHHVMDTFVLRYKQDKELEEADNKLLIAVDLAKQLMAVFNCKAMVVGSCSYYKYVYEEFNKIIIPQDIDIAINTRFFMSPETFLEKISTIDGLSATAEWTDTIYTHFGINVKECSYKGISVHIIENQDKNFPNDLVCSISNTLDHEWKYAECDSKYFNKIKLIKGWDKFPDLNCATLGRDICGWDFRKFCEGYAKFLKDNNYKNLHDSHKLAEFVKGNSAKTVTVKKPTSDVVCKIKNRNPLSKTSLVFICSTFFCALMILFSFLYYIPMPYDKINQDNSLDFGAVHCMVLFLYVAISIVGYIASLINISDHNASFFRK